MIGIDATIKLGIIICALVSVQISGSAYAADQGEQVQVHSPSQQVDDLERKKDERSNVGQPEAVDAHAQKYAEEHPDNSKVLTTVKQKADAAKQSEMIRPANVVEDEKLKKHLNTQKFMTKPTDEANPEGAVVVVKRKTVALALGGGGARGAAHIGVLRVLAREGVPIDYIVGNSMGSIVGGLYSAGVPLDKIEQVLVDGSLRKAYLPGLVPPSVLIAPITKLTHPFGKKHYAGLWSGQKFARFLDQLTPVKDQTFKDLKIPFSAVATNLADGNAYRISEGKLTTAIRASSTISPVLQPIAIGDKVYVDGAVRANLPASSARETGADFVIAVLVDDPLKPVKSERFRTLGGIVSRMSDIVLAVNDEHQLKFADVVIYPDVSDIVVSSKKHEDYKRAIAAGEAAAIKSLPSIRKTLGLTTNSVAETTSLPH